MISYNAVTINSEVKHASEIQMVNDISDATVEFTNWIDAKIVMLETAKDIIGNVTYEELTYTNTYNKYLEIGLDDAYVTIGYIGLSDGGFLSGDGWTMPDGYDPRERIWYIDAKERACTILSDVYIDSDTGERTITLSSPVYVDEELIGVIAFDIYVSSLNEKLGELSISKNAHAYLISRNGFVIGHTKHDDLIGTSVSDIEVLNDSAELSRAFKKELKTLEYQIDDEKFFSVVRVLPNSEWLIGIALRTDETYGKTYISKETIILNIVFFLLIIITLRMNFVYERLILKTNVSLEMKNEELSNAYMKINQINEELDMKSQIDAMTQIYNRGSFNNEIEARWSLAEKQKKEISIILFDIDFFKKYNDHYGHIKGDDVIIRICELVSSLLGPEDFFARFGGEEFVIIHYDNSMDKAYELGNRIIKAIYDENIEHLASELNRVTVSAGVNAMIPRNGFTIGSYIYKADIALYQAKAAGKNQVIKAETQ